MFTDKDHFTEFQYLNLGDDIEGTLCGHNGEPQQYTGLLDKNGVECYEGDVVSFEEPEFESEMLKCEVVFFKGSFCAKWSKGYIPVWDFVKDFEIIGNIYSNPELITKEL